MSKKEQIIEVLENLSTEDAVYVWNEYCEYTNNMDDYIYDMDELDYILWDLAPSDVLEAVYTDCFSINDSYFYYSIYGIKSADWLADVDCIDWDAVARFAVESDDEFNVDDIREILDEEEFEDD